MSNKSYKSYKSNRSYRSSYWTCLTLDFRLYEVEHIYRVQFIKQAQELGFSLEEIKGLLTTGGAEECRKVRDLLKRKVAELDERLKSLKDFRRVLAHHLSACEAELDQHINSVCCPVLPLKGQTKMNPASLEGRVK